MIYRVGRVQARTDNVELVSESQSVCISFRSSFDPNRVASLHTQVPEGFPQLCWCAGSTPAGYSVEHAHKRSFPISASFY